MLQKIVFRNRSASRPTMPTAVAAMVRFCGLIIFPTTPPEVLAATSRVGSRPALFAAACCRVANSAFADVSEPVTAVPIHPRTGDRNAKNAPVAAIQFPMVRVWPDRFITYARASTEATVRKAHLRLYAVLRYSRAAAPGLIR